MLLLGNDAVSVSCQCKVEVPDVHFQLLVPINSLISSSSLKTGEGNLALWDSAE